MTKRYQDSTIDVRIMLDNANNRQYNIVCVENSWAINYNDNGPELLEKVPDSFLIENLTELKVPR